MSRSGVVRSTAVKRSAVDVVHLALGDHLYVDGDFVLNAVALLDHLYRYFCSGFDGISRSVSDLCAVAHF
jgi:hypothetical protein